MKKRFFIVVLPILAIMVSLFACASPEPKVSVIAFKVPEIKLRGTKMTDTAYIYFTNSWSSDNTNDWLDVSPKSHVAKNPGRLDSIKVAFTALSPTSIERRGGVTFSQEEAMVRIIATQPSVVPSN